MDLLPFLAWAAILALIFLPPRLDPAIRLKERQLRRRMQERRR